jgi:8-oxo-dGTP diphosphatase
MTPVACAIIEDESGRVLLAKRPEGKCLSGFWEFPGGKIEAGESAEAALVRELEEELLIQTQIFQTLEAVEHHYENFSIQLIPCREKFLPEFPRPRSTLISVGFRFRKLRSKRSRRRMCRSLANF